MEKGKPCHECKYWLPYEQLPNFASPRRLFFNLLKWFGIKTPAIPTRPEPSEFDTCGAPQMQGIERIFSYCDHMRSARWGDKFCGPDGRWFERWEGLK